MQYYAHTCSYLSLYQIAAWMLLETYILCSKSYWHNRPGPNVGGRGGLLNSNLPNQLFYIISLKLYLQDHLSLVTEGTPIKEAETLFVLGQVSITMTDTMASHS